MIDLIREEIIGFVIGVIIGIVLTHLVVEFGKKKL